jgi:uncharacterized protein (DUF885 family)
MPKFTLLLVFLLVGCAQFPQTSTLHRQDSDATFNRLADEFIAGYLAWRPQTGTSLGLHEYDGKVTDLSRASLVAELSRLKSFNRRLAELDPQRLSPPAFYDYRILRGAIRRELFRFEDMQSYTQNPMTYADVLDVNIYIKRNFAPLEDRLRSIIAILNQAPNIMAAARLNLADSLPKPQVETAIEVAGGVVAFLNKDLVEALRGVKHEALMSEFNAANQRAIGELRGYTNYLKEQKLPVAHHRYALGREKYAKMLRGSEMITLSPEQLLDLGLRELRREQRTFAETGKLIDPNKTPLAVFKAIQKEHPTEENLIADTQKNLETIRQFLIDRKILTLPSAGRVQVAETPQFMRAMSFASMDTPGPFETQATEAYYYVTPVEKDWSPLRKEEWLTAFNYYATDVVSIHEAYPGHYIQFLCLNASPATQLEKIFSSYAFVEGWAHYAEQMLLDEGFGASPMATPTQAAAITAAKYRLVQSDEALL